jgi:hypothetical protein
VDAEAVHEAVELTSWNSKTDHMQLTKSGYRGIKMLEKNGSLKVKTLEKNGYLHRNFM